MPLLRDDTLHSPPMPLLRDDTLHSPRTPLLRDDTLSGTIAQPHGPRPSAHRPLPPFYRATSSRTILPRGPTAQPTRGDANPTAHIALVSAIVQVAP